MNNMADSRTGIRLPADKVGSLEIAAPLPALARAQLRSAPPSSKTGFTNSSSMGGMNDTRGQSLPPSGFGSPPCTTSSLSSGVGSFALQQKSVATGEFSEGLRGQLDALRSLEGYEELGGSTYGSGRRLVMELKESVKQQRRRDAREAGFSLDCVGVSKHEALRVPRYLPYYDETQAIFLKARERRAALLQSYDWKDMTRDQSAVMKHNVALLERRGRGTIASRQSPAATMQRFDQRVGAAAGFVQLNTSLASSESGRWTPGVSFRGATVDPGLASTVAKADRKAAHRAVTHAVTQGVANGSSSSSQIATSPITPGNDNNGIEEGSEGGLPVEASVELSAAEQLALKLSGQEALTQQELPTSATGLLRVQSLHDSSTSPAFRRALMVSLRQHGVPVVQSPYKSMAPLLKHQKHDDIDDTDGGGFSVSEVRSVIRYIEDIADSVAGESRNGEIEFEELDLAFRQAHRSRAAAQYEKAGRAAMHKLELLLRMREISIVQWFNEVDSQTHRNGYLSHADLIHALMALTDARQHQFNPHALLKLQPGSSETEVHSAFEAYKVAHEDGEAGIEQFYNVKAAREQAYAKATIALSKAQRQNQAAQKNSAAATLFSMPNQFDDQFAQNAQDHAEASEKAVVEASKAKEHAKQVAVAAKADAQQADADVVAATAAAAGEDMRKESTGVDLAPHNEMFMNKDSDESSAGPVERSTQRLNSDDSTRSEDDDQSNTSGGQEGGRASSPAVDNKEAQAKAEELKAREKAAKKEADALEAAEMSHKKDPEGHFANVQRAFDCLTVPEQKANFEQFGHPDGQSPDTIDPFSLHEVEALLRYMDPDADGRCSLQEVTMALRRSHQNQKESANEAVVSKIMEKLENEMHGEGGGHKMRVKDLFNKLDEDGNGSISSAELRRGLAIMSGPTLAERFAKKQEELKAARRRANAMSKVLQEGELRQRLASAKASGAYDLLLHLDRVMKSDQLSPLELFRIFDKDGSGELNVDEFMDGLAKYFRAELQFSKKQVRALVDFFDANGDGEIEPDEFSDVIKQLRKDIRKAKMLEKPKAGAKKQPSSAAVQLQKDMNAMGSFTSDTSSNAPTSVVTFKT